jgi:hypothetical protein
MLFCPSAKKIIANSIGIKRKPRHLTAITFDDHNYLTFIVADIEYRLQS